MLARCVATREQGANMSIQAVLLPVFLLVGLTFYILFVTAWLRYRAVKEGETKVRDIALGQPNWPSRTMQYGNAYSNQLQLPVLFYVLVTFALLLHKTDTLFIVMSWAFVGLRYAHAYIHITSNYVPNRFSTFVAGTLLLIVMWLVFAVRVLFAF